MIVFKVFLLVTIILVVVSSLLLLFGSNRSGRSSRLLHSPRSSFVPLRSTSLPISVDLRQSACFPYIRSENQGSNESCVAHSFAAALYCAKAAAGLSVLPVSEIGFPNVDELFGPALAESSDARRGVSFAGLSKQIRSTHGADLDALSLSIVEISTGLEATNSVRETLALGYPVVAGYQVDETIDAFHKSASACERHGFLLPSFQGDAISAHAVLIVGYDDRIQCFIARNSWGVEWGVGGHFLIRYTDVVDDVFFTDFAAIYKTHQR